MPLGMWSYSTCALNVFQNFLSGNPIMIPSISSSGILFLRRPFLNLLMSWLSHLLLLQNSSWSAVLESSTLCWSVWESASVNRRWVLQGKDHILFIFVPVRYRNFPGGSTVKNLPANEGDVGDLGPVPGLGRSPGGGHGHPLQFSCLENPKDRGAWWAMAHGVAKSRTRLRKHTGVI